MPLSTIYGQVIDQVTGDGIKGVMVIIETNSESTSTKSIESGSYLIDVKPNTKSRLTFQAEGYYPKTRGSIEFNNHHFSRLDIALQPMDLFKKIQFSFGIKKTSSTKWVTLETIIINNRNRVEYSKRLKTWKIIK